MDQPTFDFDTPVERRQTGSTKWDKYAGRDVIPLWVADMDFRSPPCVVDALHARAAHGVFGYTDPMPALYEAIMAHLEQEYRWKINKEWLIWLPGLVTGLNVVARAFCSPGQQAVTATPVYPPFLSAPAQQGAEVLRIPMLCNDGRWQWDLPGLDAALSPRVRLLSLCNPHNPVGRVFSRQELEDLAERCLRHDLIMCSDEIHCGLVLDPEARHVPVASLDADIAARSVTLMAASKTFNLPGLGCAFAIVPDATLRARLKRASAGIVPRVNALGFDGTMAAYRDGGPWRSALLDYLRGNRDLVLQRLAAMPLLKTYRMEATYLAWIDARSLQTEDPARFFEAAGVGLSDGAEFGTPGFVRLNFGCHRKLLTEGLDRIQRALT